MGLTLSLQTPSFVKRCTAAPFMVTVAFIALCQLLYLLFQSPEDIQLAINHHVVLQKTALPLADFYDKENQFTTLNTLFLKTEKLLVYLSFKAMEQLDHVALVIAITICNAIWKKIIKIDFWYQTYVKKKAKVFLVQKIYFSYKFLNNLTYCNCNHRRHVVWFIHDLKFIRIGDDYKFFPHLLLEI